MPPTTVFQVVLPSRVLTPQSAEVVHANCDERLRSTTKATCINVFDANARQANVPLPLV